MPLLNVDGENIGRMNDGYLGRCIDEALLTVSSDIDGRGQDGLVREITIKIKFKPDGPEKDGKRNVKITSEVRTKVPATKPPEMVAKLDHAHGGMTFRADSPMDPEQRTFNDIDVQQ